MVSWQIIKDFLQRALFPSDPLAALRGAFVALSLLVLMKHASAHKFSDVLTLFVETYDALLTKLLSPFKPALDQFVEKLSQFWGYDVALQDYWKHIFILLMIYFMSRAAGAYSMQRYGTATFRLFWGILVAFAFSVLASIEAENFVPVSQDFRIAFSAIACIAVYEIGINIWFATFFREHQAKVHHRATRNWASEFYNLSKEDGLRLLSGTALTTVMLLLPWPEVVLRPEIVVLAVLAFLHGCFWIVWGWRQTRFEPRLSGRLESAKRNSDIIVGIAMIRSFVYAFIAVVLDAAARLI